MHVVDAQSISDHCAYLMLSGLTIANGADSLGLVYGVGFVLGGFAGSYVGGSGN